MSMRPSVVEIGRNQEPPEEKPVAPKSKQYRAVYEWLRWAGEESNAMILPMLSQLKLAPPPRRNPLYWGTWSATAGMLLAGRFVHKLFGQQDPVRRDEIETEHEVRVQWIYANDSTYALSVAMDIWCLGRDINILYWHTHVRSGHMGAISTLVGVVLLLATILGNVAFYESMRKRSLIGVRVCVAANTGFAFAMSVALIFAARRKGLKMVKKSWFMRALAVFFAMLALPTYAKLWNVYADGSCGIFTLVTGSRHSIISRRLSIVTTTAVFLAVTGCLFLAFRYDGKAVWETFG